VRGGGNVYAAVVGGGLIKAPPRNRPKRPEESGKAGVQLQSFVLVGDEDKNVPIIVFEKVTMKRKKKTKELYKLKRRKRIKNRKNKQLGGGQRRDR